MTKTLNLFFTLNLKYYGYLTIFVELLKSRNFDYG